ncbi:MAG: arsenic transporter [Corynebacteriales bacterium]|nr:arsenic transporter [Mycobacteriales bacterium]
MDKNEIRERPSRLTFDVLDGLVVAVFCAGILCVLTGALPASEAMETGQRIAPLLLFLGTVIIFAELLAKAGVFATVAVWIARLAGGSRKLLFLLCVVFASLTTIFLNLDTTAVLLTPVMLVLAQQIGVSGVPLAMTTVWLANTASLLLPVSNLTNLLAMNRLGLSTLEFASRMWVPQLVAIVVSAGLLWFFYWRAPGEPSRYEVPTFSKPEDQALFRLGACCSVAFVVIMLLGVPLAVVSFAAAMVMVLAILVRRRGWLTAGLLPWRLLLFVSGLFLVIQTITVSGLGPALLTLVGTESGATGMLRTAASGALLANLINNLPSYIALEQVISPGKDGQLFALIIGTNIGPLIAPWASLAILLWFERCRAAGLTIQWRRFIGTGAITAVLTIAATMAAFFVMS